MKKIYYVRLGPRQHKIAQRLQAQNLFSKKLDEKIQSMTDREFMDLDCWSPDKLRRPTTIYISESSLKRVKTHIIEHECKLGEMFNAIVLHLDPAGPYQDPFS